MGEQFLIFFFCFQIQKDKDPLWHVPVDLFRQNGDLPPSVVVNVQINGLLLHHNVD